MRVMPMRASTLAAVLTVAVAWPIVAEAQGRSIYTCTDASGKRRRRTARSPTATIASSAN